MPEDGPFIQSISLVSRGATGIDGSSSKRMERLKGFKWLSQFSVFGDWTRIFYSLSID